jgi:hypothetical protein
MFSPYLIVISNKPSQKESVKKGRQNLPDLTKNNAETGSVLPSSPITHIMYLPCFDAESHNPSGGACMSGQIFYRQRAKAKEGSRTPRFRVIAVSGVDLKIYGNHFRKKELEQIAKTTGAELIAVERDENAAINK